MFSLSFARSLRSVCVLSLMLSAFRPVVTSAIAAPLPPPTFIPPIEGNLGQASQAFVAGPMGLDISIFDLSLRAQRSDLAIGGCSLPLETAFVYESNGRSNDSGFGFGWRYLYGASYRELADGSVVIGPIQGQTQRLWPGSDGLSRPEPGRLEYRTSDGTTYYFDDSTHKQATKVADRNGGFLVLVYDSDGRLIQIADHYGRKLDFSYSGGHLTRISDANASPVRSVQYSYDAADNLVAVIDLLGNTTAYAYTDSHALVKLVDPLENWAEVRYNTNEENVAQITTRSSAVQFQHAEGGRLLPFATYVHYTTVTDVTNGTARTTRYDFARNGQFRKVTDLLGYVTRMGQDGQGNITSYVDENGNATGYQYDSAGRLLQVTEPLSRTTTYTYDPLSGRLASSSDPLGHTTRHGYDGAGNLISQTDPLSKTITFTYEAWGNLATVSDPLSNTVTFSYDAYGYPAAIQDGAGVSISYDFDRGGNLLQITDDLGGVTALDYDLLGRTTAMTTPIGATSRLTYDAGGNLTLFSGPDGRQVTYSYDAQGRPLTLRDAVGEVNYIYNAADNVTGIINGEGHWDTFTYDLIGRMTGRSDALGRTTAFAYDGAGNLIGRTDPLSRTTVYTYSAADELAAVTYPDGRAAAFEYDAASNRLREANETVAVKTTYDAANRVTEVDAAGKVIRYTYDAAGRRSSMTDPDGNSTTYSYDGGGRLSSVADSLAGTTTYTYDTAGRLSRVDRANGVYSVYTFDPAARLESLVHHAPGGAVLQSFVYTYDAAGNRTSMTTGEGQTTYSYDARHRLIQVRYPDGSVETFSYDRAGNRLSSSGVSSTYDAADQLLAAGSATFSWDSRGNQTGQSAGGQPTSYHYDHENRLVAVDYGDGSSTSYAYYPDGRLFQRTGRDGQVTTYLYDGPNLLMEIDGSGNTLARYTSGLDLDAWLAVQRGGQTYTYLRDGLNSVVGLTDGNGTQVASYRYDAFGGLRAEAGSAANPLRFTGRYWDGDAELYLYRARWYDPAIGRFLSRDPLGPTLVREPYAYASNNPVTYVDPLGLQPRYDTWLCDIGKGSVGFLFGYEYSTLRCENQRTHQVCTTTQRCYKLGAVAGFFFGGCKGFQVNGPTSGWDLINNDWTQGWSIFAEAGAGLGIGAGIEANGSTVDMGREVNGCLGTGQFGVELGLGGQHCRTTVNSCTRTEPDARPKPPTPPYPPGQDHADDNHSAASPVRPGADFRSPLSERRLSPAAAAALPVLAGEARVGILWHGNAEDAQALLGSLGWPSEPAYLDFDPGQMDLPVLLIPSGGLFGLEGVSSFRARLEAYVAAGGAIVALAQQHGYEFASLPGGQLSGYGWTEDNSCFDASLYISDYHPIFSGFSKSTLTAGVDGYFSSLADGARKLLYRTKNGQPALVLYPYQAGWVVAASIYDDWGASNQQPPGDTRRLLRDLLSWAVDAGGPLPKFSPGADASVPVSATNAAGLAAAQLQITVLDPDGLVYSQQTIAQAIPPGGQAQHTVQLGDLPARLGIWWVQIALLDSSGDIVQPAAWAGRFAVSQPNPAGGPGKAMGLSITAPSEYFIAGPAEFTFHLYNFTDSPRQATVRYGLPHHTWESGNPAYGDFYGLSQTVTVPAQGEETFTHSAAIFTNDRLFARLEYDGLHQATWFQVNLAAPAVDVSARPAQPEYSRGSTAQVTVVITDTSQAFHAATLNVTIRDSGGHLLHNIQQPLNLVPASAEQVEFSFAIPITARPGSATVLAEVREGGGLVIGRDMASFRIPTPPLVFETALPTVLIPGSSQAVVVTATNTSAALDVVSVTLAITLTDPAGTMLPLAPQAFAVPAGQQAVVSAPFTTPAARFGPYVFDLASVDEYDGRAWQVTAPNEPVLTVQFDRGSYAVRELVSARVVAVNLGRWQQSPQLRVEVPDAGYSQVAAVDLDPGRRVTTTHSVALPGTLSAGSHPLIATLSLDGGSAISITASVVVPVSRLEVSLAVPEEKAGQAVPRLGAGESFTVGVSNRGGADTDASYRLSLQSPRGATLQSAGGVLAGIQAGATQFFLVTVPAQAASGTYFVRTIVTDTQTGVVVTPIRNIAVDGLELDLQVATDQPIYGTGEPITAGVTATHQAGGPLSDAMLNLAIDGPPTWRWTGFGPGYYGPASSNITTVAPAGGSVVWIGQAQNQSSGEPSGLSAYDYGGSFAEREDDRWLYYEVARQWGDLRAIAADDHGYLWLAFQNTVSPIAVLDVGTTPFDEGDDRWEGFGSSDGLPSGAWPQAVAVDNSGLKWFGTSNGALVLDDGGTPFDKADDQWAAFNTGDGLTNPNVVALVVDSGNRKWFATGAGASVLDDGGTPFDKSDDVHGIFSGQDGLANPYTNDLVVDGGGYVWIATASGVSILDINNTPADKSDDRWRTLTPDDGLISYPIYALAIDQDQIKWFAGSGGLSRFDDGGTPFDPADDAWTNFPLYMQGSNGANGLAFDAANRIWIAQKQGGAVVGASSGGAIWSEISDLDLGVGGSAVLPAVAPAIAAPGPYRLTGVLSSPLGQELARAHDLFYVSDAAASLTLEAAPDPVEASGTLLVRGALVNQGEVALANQTLTLSQDGSVIYSEDPFDVPAGASHPFDVAATAPASGTSTQFEASTAELNTSLAVAIAWPELAATLSAPDLVGSDSFSVTVTLDNTGNLAGQAVVAFADAPVAVTIPAGESRLVQGDAQVCGDTTLSIPVSGDLATDLAATVDFGQAVTASFAAPAIASPGLVAIPYTLTNSGQLDAAASTAVTVTGAAKTTRLRQFSAYLPVGGTAAGSLLFDLPAGAYTLTYRVNSGPCQLTAGQEAFTVKPAASLDMAVAASPIGPARIVTATVTNSGSQPFSGTLRLNSGYGVQIEQPAALAVDASGVYTFALDISLASAGVHTATVTALDGSGTAVAASRATLAVAGPQFSVTGLPVSAVLPAGQTVTATFAVANQGDQAGLARLRFALGDIEDETQVRQIEAGGAAEGFDFSFYVPQELASGDYLATYDLNGQEGQLTFTVQGISLTVSAATDRPAYGEGEPAMLLLTVTNHLASPVPGLYALVNLKGITQTQAFALPGTASKEAIADRMTEIALTFPVTATFGDGGLIFYGIYHEDSQRGLYLGTRRLAQRQPAVTVLLERPLYAPGDEIRATVLTTATGRLQISAPGYAADLFLAGVDTAFSFNLPSPMLRGTYAVSYRLTGCGCPEEGRQRQAAFDVDGPLVRVTEARLANGSYDAGSQVNLRLTVASDRALDVTLRSTLLYPDGTAGATGQQAARLAASPANWLTATATLSGTQAGLHLLRFDLVDPIDPGLVYASGVEGFDVGQASLLSVSTDQADYPTGTGTVTATVQVYALQAATGQLTLALDGAAPQVLPVSLAVGSQSLNFALAQPIDPGQRVLSASLASAGLSSQSLVTFTYGSDLPDLLVSAPLLALGQPGPDQAINLVVTNGGAGGAATTTVSVYEGDLHAGGALIGTAAVPALGSSSSAVLAVSWERSSHQGGAAVTLTARVDPVGALAEFDENNNDAAATIILPALYREDANDDGMVDVLDLQLVAGGWNGFEGRLDMDQDGDVDVTDIMLVIGRWTAAGR